MCIARQAKSNGFSIAWRDAGGQPVRDALADGDAPGTIRIAGDPIGRIT